MKFLQDIPKEKLQKIILVAIIGLALTSAVFIFHVNRQLNAIRAAEKTAADLNNQIIEAEKQTKASRQLELEREVITKFADTQHDSMVTGDPLSWAIRAVSDLAAQHPVRVLGWRPSGKSPHRSNSRYEVFTMQVDMEGAFDALGQFIEALENKYASAEIRQMEVLALNPAEPKRRVNFSISFVVLPESQQPATSTKPI